jgi:hypothetical protein
MVIPYRLLIPFADLAGRAQSHHQKRPAAAKTMAKRAKKARETIHPQFIHSLWMACSKLWMEPVEPVAQPNLAGAGGP